jgi:ligand-binding sensor protein
MTPWDVMSKDEWNDVLDQFAQNTKMPACLGEPKESLMHCRSERTPLCLAIRSNQETLSSICYQASTTMNAIIAKTLKPEIDYCQAGLMRVVVPIVRDNSVIGQVFACGLATEEEEIEVLLLAKQLGISQDEVWEMVKSIPVGIEEVVENQAADLFDKINAVCGGR